MSSKAYATLTITDVGDGVGVNTITYTYAVTTTQTEPSASSITSTAMPTLSSTNKFLWRKEVITYTDSTKTPKTTVSLIAVYGDTGDTGGKGVGINKITPLYYTSNSATKPSKPTTSTTIVDDATQYNKWNRQVASLTETYNHFYTCDEILYGDASGTKEWTDVVEHNIYVELNNNVTDLNKWKTEVEFKISDEGIKSIVSGSLNVGAINLIRNSETLEFADYYFDGSVVATQSENQTTIRGVANAYQINNSVKIM